MTTPLVNVSAQTASVNEGGATNLVYKFTRTGDTSSPLTINFDVSGTASTSVLIREVCHCMTTYFATLANSLFFTKYV